MECEITIRRVGGTIETVVHPKIGRMTEELWKLLKDAAKKRGAGEYLSYRNVPAPAPAPAPAPITLHCDRCGVEIPPEAYSQWEWYRGMRVRASYCAGCAGVLRAVGAGEMSAMKDRRTDRGDEAPETKGDGDGSGDEDGSGSGSGDGSGDGSAK
jgi:hypothetical protein